MASNSFGQVFRITTSGESHGKGLGVIIDGCPPGIPVDTSLIQRELDRRRPGQSPITTQRKESDLVTIQSGLFDGKTTGAPILLLIPNMDMRPSDYEQIAASYRPSHADFTYEKKYGFRDPYGGGRSSARETANWVAAGAIAKAFLSQHGIEIRAAVTSIGTVDVSIPLEGYDWPYVEQNAVRSPDAHTTARMLEEIESVRNAGDTIGGKITCLVTGCPVGLGQPVFHKLQADLAHAMLSINACKGFEYGSGFEGSSMRGSLHNDRWIQTPEGIKTASNFSGGIQGGISNSMPIYFRTAFKPVSTLMHPQTSVDPEGNPVVLEGKGRHDPCVVPRAVPIVEALTALVLTDHLLLTHAYQRK